MIEKPSQSIILDIERQLMHIEKHIVAFKQYEQGLYLKGHRYPFTKHKDGLFIYPGNIPLDLSNDIPRDININIIDKNGDLIISGYNLVNRPDVVSKEPFYSIHGLELLKLLVDYLQYNNNPNKELYFNNPISCSSVDPLIDPITPTFIYVEDIITHMYPFLPGNKVADLTNFLFTKIIPILDVYMDYDRNALYTIETYRTIIELNRMSDIRAIRYSESCIDKMEAEECNY